MNTLDIGALIKVVVGVVPASRAAGATNGTGVDRAVAGSATTNPNYDSAVLYTRTGAATGTPDSLTVVAKIQDSADNTNFDDFKPDGVNIATHTVAAASTDGQLSINLRGARRYIRVVETAAFVNGTTPQVVSTSVLVLGTANINPI